MLVRTLGDGGDPALERSLRPGRSKGVRYEREAITRIRSLTKPTHSHARGISRSGSFRRIGCNDRCSYIFPRRGAIGGTNRVERPNFGAVTPSPAATSTRGSTWGESASPLIGAPCLRSRAHSLGLGYKFRCELPPVPTCGHPNPALLGGVCCQLGKLLGGRSAHPLRKCDTLGKPAGPYGRRPSGHLEHLRRRRTIDACTRRGRIPII